MALDNDNSKSELGFSPDFNEEFDALNLGVFAASDSLDDLPLLKASDAEKGSDRAGNLFSDEGADNFPSLKGELPVPKLSSLKPAGGADFPVPKGVASIKSARVPGLGAKNAAKEGDAADEGLPLPKGPGLPIPKTAGGADFPVPKGAASIKSARVPGIPSIASLSGGASGDGLPLPKGLSIPAPKAPASGGDGLPLPKGLSIPAPKAPADADFPVPKMSADADSPVPKMSADADFPVPKMSADADFPVPKGAVSIKSPRSQDSVSASNSADEGLPLPKGFDLPSPKFSDSQLEASLKETDDLPSFKLSGNEFEAVPFSDSKLPAFHLDSNLDVNASSSQSGIPSDAKPGRRSHEYRTVNFMTENQEDHEAAEVSSEEAAEQPSNGPMTFSESDPAQSSNGAHRSATMAMRMFSFDEALVSSDDHKAEEDKNDITGRRADAIEAALAGFQDVMSKNGDSSNRRVDSSQPSVTGSPVPTLNSGLIAPKVRLLNKGTVKADPLNLSLDSYELNRDLNRDINNDSGLPINDDPLGVMGVPSRGKVAETREQRSGLLRIDFSDGEERVSSQIPDAISKEQYEKDMALEQTALGHKSNSATKVSSPDDILGLFSNTEAPKAPPVPPKLPLKAGTLSAGGNVKSGEVDEVRSGLPNQESITENEMVFDIASIRGDNVNKVDAKTEANNKLAQATEAAKRRKKQIIIAIAVIVLLLAAAGVFAGKKWIESAIHVDEDELAPMTMASVNHLNGDLIKSDNLASYKQFFDKALANLRVPDISEADRLENQGMAIVTVLLGDVRYRNDLTDSYEKIESSIETIEASNKCNGGWCAVGLWGWALLHNDSENAAKYQALISSEAPYAQIRALIDAIAISKQLEETYTSFDDRMASLNRIKDSVKDISDWMLADYLYAKACMRRGEFDEASARIEKYLGNEEVKYSGALVLAADIAYQTGKYSEAIETAQRVIDLKTGEKETDLYAQKTLLRAQASSQEWGVFSKNLEDNLKEYAAKPALLETIADICIQLGRADACRILIQTLIDSDPKNVKFRELYARVYLYAIGLEKLFLESNYLNKQDLDNMEANLSEAITLDASNIALWTYRSVVEFARGNYQNSLEALVETERSPYFSWVLVARDLIEKKIEGQNWADPVNGVGADYFAPWIEKASDATEFYILLALLNRMNSSESALELANKAIKLYPQDSRIRMEQITAAMALSERETVESGMSELKKMNALTNDQQFAMAKFVNDMGDADSALKRMSVLVAQEPNNPIFLYYIGKLFFDRGVYDSAKTYFEKTLTLDVTNAETYFYNGRCAYELGDFTTALNQFNEAHSKDEHNRTYTLWTANALSKLDMIDDALSTYSVIITDWKGNADLRASAGDAVKAEVAYAYFQRALLYQIKQKRSEASEDFAQAEKLDPDNIEITKGYATFLYEAGDPKDVLKKLKIVESVPDAMDATRYYVKGLALLKLDKRSEALAAFELARDSGFADLEQTGISGLRDPAEIYERIGYMYRDAGRKKEAAEMLRHYIEISKFLSDRSKREISHEIEHL